LGLTPPRGRDFKHILYPDSLKTTLMQVCDESYSTFQAAHHNMDKLRQQSARVPRLLSDIVELLLTGTDENIYDYLPMLLKGVKNIAQQSKKLSEQTADKFNQTAILIDEVTLASKSSEGKSKNDLKQAKVDVEISKRNLELRKKIKEETKEALETAKEKAADAESEYKKASLGDIIKLLKRALAVLSELSKQWRKMADFFESINTMVQTWEEGPQKQFIQIVEKRSENVRSKQMTNVAKRLMFGYARESAGYAFVINRVSNGYFKISSKYLLIPMASLKELMTLDASDTKMLIQKKNKLKSQTEEAMAHIKTLGEKETDMAKTILEKRMKDMDKEFNVILSKIPPQEKHAIIQNTKADMKKLNYTKTKVSIVEGQLKQFSKIGDDDFLDDDDFLNDV